MSSLSDEFTVTTLKPGEYLLLTPRVPVTEGMVERLKEQIPVALRSRVLVVAMDAVIVPEGDPV